MEDYREKDGLLSPPFLHNLEDVPMNVKEDVSLTTQGNFCSPMKTWLRLAGD